MAACGLALAADASAEPSFQLPFPCRETWFGHTWHGHAPSTNAIDWNLPGGTDAGRRVLASAGGRATIVSQADGKVDIDHGGGWVTRYQHLGSIQDWIDGQTIPAHTWIGAVGKRGTTSPHLHYEQRLHGVPQPAKFEGQAFVYVTTEPGRAYTSTNCGPGPYPDINDDRVVNIYDLDILLSSYGKSGAAVRYRGDVNRDGTVDLFDLSILLSRFGQRSSSVHELGAAPAAHPFGATRALVTAAATGVAPEGATTRISDGVGGAQAVAASSEPSISRDGRFVAFASDAPLVAGDTNGKSDIFLYDRQLDTMERVSVSSTGAQSTDHSYHPHISPDGHLVVFDSDAPLTPYDVNGRRDVFLRYRVAGALLRVSTQFFDSTENGANDNSFATGVSSGGHVVFESWATNIVSNDTDGSLDVFVRDMFASPSNAQRVSVPTSGTATDGDSYEATVTEDGRYVAFGSRASNLVGGDHNGFADSFLRDRVAGTTTLISRAAGGGPSAGTTNATVVSGDGRYVAFDSNASDLVPGDANNVRDVFVWDRTDGVIRRVSVTDDGVEGNDASVEPAFSGFGDMVGFRSLASNLVPGDVNGTEDVFVHWLGPRLTERVLFDSAGGEPNGFSYRPALSWDGRFVAVASDSSNLVPNDTNGAVDIFVRDRGVPYNSTPPYVVGAARVGAGLKGYFGEWRHTYGGEPGYRAQWQACGADGEVSECVDVPGASDASYTPQPADVGNTMRLSVTATNDVGTTVAHSVVTEPVEPNVPSAPRDVSATPRNAGATVSFAPPAFDGGAAVVAYRVTSTPGGITATGAASPIQIDGLTNGVPYRFSVVATNAAGDGAESALSNEVTPSAPLPPDTFVAGGTAGTTAAATTRFTFSTDQPGATFECRLDGGAWASCSSPHDQPLTVGRLTLEVRAVNGNGPDPTPAVRTLRVVQPFVVDWDGDGKANVGVWRPATGGWLAPGAASAWFGWNGDVPVPGQWDADPAVDRAIWRPESGGWYVEGSAPDWYGLATDVPVPGQWDGDPELDRAVWRPAVGGWYVQGQPTSYYGRAGDVPVPGDYDADPELDRAVFRPSNGGWYVEGSPTVFHGASGDIPVPADWSGDGKTDIAVYRPSNAGWYVRNVATTFFGSAGDVPLAGDYDADPAIDRVLFRPSTGAWYVDAPTPVAYFGTATDIP